MVLDPLSAFAVACNVLQIIEVSAKVLSKAAEYRSSEAGVLDEQKDLRDVLQSLSNLNADIQALLPAPLDARRPSFEEACLSQANLQCLQILRDFIGLLDSLKLRGKHAVFDSFRMSVKSLWHRDKMAAMEKSLAKARDNLNVTFLVYMKYIADIKCLNVRSHNISARGKLHRPRNKTLSRLLPALKAKYYKPSKKPQTRFAKTSNCWRASLALSP